MRSFMTIVPKGGVADKIRVQGLRVSGAWSPNLDELLWSL